MFYKLFLTLIVLHPVYYLEACTVGLIKNKVNCQFYYNQLRSLTTLACVNLAQNNLTALNACSSCFSVAIGSNQSAPSLIQMSTCANLYLLNTMYNSCTLILGNDTINMVGVQTVGCQSGFCGFARCLRRMNSNLLISNCFNQVATTNNLSTNTLRIQFYKDVTSCILARARCNPINPITGQSQNNRFLISTSGCIGRTNKVTRLVNTLQINSVGDLQIIAFSANTNVAGNQLCSSNVLPMQSGYANVTCP